MLSKIIDLQLALVQKRLDEKNIRLTVSVQAKKHLTKKGFDPAYGARPLKRVIQNGILDELALEIIEGKVKVGDRVKVEVKDGRIVFC